MSTLQELKNNHPTFFQKTKSLHNESFNIRNIGKDCYLIATHFINGFQDKPLYRSVLYLENPTEDFTWVKTFEGKYSKNKALRYLDELKNQS